MAFEMPADAEPIGYAWPMEHIGAQVPHQFAAVSGRCLHEQGGAPTADTAASNLVRILRSAFATSCPLAIGHHTVPLGSANRAVGFAELR